MAMISFSSAKDWLSEHHGQDDGADYAEEEAAKEDELLLLSIYKLQSTSSLASVKLMPESALTEPKEKKLTRRLWFETGKSRGAVVTADQESEEEDDEDIDFDDEDFEDDEDMLDHYLAEKSDASALTSRA